MASTINLLSADTRLGYVHYTVSNLENQIHFYTQILGLQLHWRDENNAGLGTGKKDLLLFTEDKNARRYNGVTGLYHQAFLLPNRKELARAIKRIMAFNYPQSPTDHTISQTTYLDDPEGNTIELLADTPEEGTWEITDNNFVARDKQGKTKHPSAPLNLPDLFSHLSPNENIMKGIPADTITGHVHLYVNNLDAAMHFYQGVLGFHKQYYYASFKWPISPCPTIMCILLLLIPGKAREPS